MNKRKIYVVGGATNYANWMEGTLVPTMQDADLVVFTGGEDVNPALYNEDPHPTTGFNAARDINEVGSFSRAVHLQKRMIGICRGSQFLCVMNGGKLVQHMENHGGHELTVVQPYSTIPGYAVIRVTSTHHQAQYPWGVPGERFRLLGWTKGYSRFHEGAGGKEMLKLDDMAEVEDVYYPENKCLAIQSHPEMAIHDDVMITHYRKLLDMHMEDKL